MKFKIALIFITSYYYYYAYSQHGDVLKEKNDWFYGSSFYSDKIIKNNKELFITGWSNSKDNFLNSCQYPPLKQYEYLHLNENINNNVFIKPQGFSFKRSDIDRSVHYVYLIHNYEIMKIKVIKNLKGWTT